MGSTVLGTQLLDRTREFGVGSRVDGAVNDRRARGMVGKRVARFPVPSRTYRSRHEAAAAVRTDPQQHRVHATLAEGALEAADPGIGRFGGQGSVAVLAGRTQAEHLGLSGRVKKDGGTPFGRLMVSRVPSGSGATLDNSPAKRDGLRGRRSPRPGPKVPVPRTITCMSQRTGYAGACSFASTRRRLTRFMSAGTTASSIRSHRPKVAGKTHE